MTDRPYRRARSRRTTLAITGAITGATAALLALGGCQTNSDPAQGGFLSGIAGITSGSYDQRLQAQQSQLSAAQATNAGLRQQAYGVQQEQAATSAQVAAAERRLYALNRDIDSLNARVAEARREERLSTAEYDRLQAEIADIDLQRQLLASDPVVGPDEKARRIAELERRQRALEQALQAALGG